MACDNPDICRLSVSAEYLFCHLKWGYGYIHRLAVADYAHRYVLTGVFLQFGCELGVGQRGSTGYTYYSVAFL